MIGVCPSKGRAGAAAAGGKGLSVLGDKGVTCTGTGRVAGGRPERWVCVRVGEDTVIRGDPHEPLHVQEEKGHEAHLLGLRRTEVAGPGPVSIRRSAAGCVVRAEPSTLTGGLSAAGWWKLGWFQEAGGGEGSALSVLFPQGTQRGSGVQLQAMHELSLPPPGMRGTGCPEPPGWTEPPPRARPWAERCDSLVTSLNPL